MTATHEERKTYDPDSVPRDNTAATRAIDAKPDSTDRDEEVVATGTAAGAWTAPARPDQNDWLSPARSYADGVLHGQGWRGEAPVIQGAPAAKGEAVSDETGNDPQIDDMLSQDITHRVMATDYIDVSHVHVAVARANVTLTGSVSTERQLKEIEALVAGCHGVRRIDNRLRIQSTAGGR